MVAGGHSLMPMMKLRLAQPEALIDINDLTELAYIRVDGDELGIGAMTRHAELLESAVVGEHYPILHDAERVIADPIVRNRGTVGGSLCQADPAEDLSAAFAALRRRPWSSAVAAARAPCRRASSTSGPTRPSSARPRCSTEVRVPIRPGGGSAYEKVERRAGDWAVAAAGACRRGSTGGSVADVGIGLTAVGAEHFAAPEAEDVPARAAGHRGELRRGGPHRRRALQPDRRPARPGRLQAPPGRRAHRCARCAARPPGPGARRPDMQVTVTVNGESHTARRRAAPAARALPPRRPGPDRHPLGLRHLQLRRVHRAARRRAGEVAAPCSR